MRHQEYERRRRMLEQHLQADLDLIRAAYAAKLRALEAVWLHSPGEDAPSPVQPEPGIPSETPLSETPPSETVRAVRRGDTLQGLRAALPDLPEVFEKEDVFQALGYTPSRATLYRAFQTLQIEKRISIARYSDGGTRTQYRKEIG